MHALQGNFKEMPGHSHLKSKILSKGLKCTSLTLKCTSLTHYKPKPELSNPNSWIKVPIV